MRVETTAPRLAADRLAVYRALLSIGVVLHFGPSVISFDDNYSRHAYLKTDSPEWLQRAALSAPVWLTEVMAWSTLTAALLLGLGWRPQVSSTIVSVGLLHLLSINTLNTQTLALSSLWGVLLLWVILGERTSKTHQAGKSCSRELLCQLVPSYLLGTVFFSGVHKVLAGWPLSGSLNRLANYPDGGILRSWIQGYGTHLSTRAGHCLELATLLSEIVVPVLILAQPTRKSATFVYVLFFVAVGLTLAVPPLFLLLFLGGAVLFKHLSWNTFSNAVREL